MAEMILRCSCCGFNYALPDGLNLLTCPACGTQNARPASKGESLELLQRAIDQRLACDFVNAEASYQRVLGHYPREHEALWGRLLCHYGVEYVRDNRTGQHLPTVHTVHPMPLRANQEFAEACRLAPEDVRAQYERDGAYIDEAQEAIRQLAKRCPAYDIFLCHKTTKTGSSEKTQDYVRALELHQLLTAKGYRVFFAPISLASVAGANYEAGIYHALHTAKVMLLVCSDAEYLVSPWVQSEWSRFLALMNVDAERRLAPLLYEHFSPARLPQMLRYRNLQGLDMGQLNAKDDLLGLVKECIGGNAPEDGDDDPRIAPLLERTRMFMEDGEWVKADEYAERVLDIDPKNGAAYVCKLLIQYKCVKIDDLKAQQNRDHEGNGNYKKAMTFANAATKKRLADVGESIDRRNEEKRLAGLYEEAANLMSREQWQQAKAQFRQLGDYRDAKKKAETCRERIVALDSAYVSATEQMKAGKYREAIAGFESLRDYKDAKSLLIKCRQSLEREKKEEKYNDAKAMMDNGVYEAAARKFESLGNYGDAREMAAKCYRLKKQYTINTEPQSDSAPAAEAPQPDKAKAQAPSVQSAQEKRKNKADISNTIETVGGFIALLPVALVVVGGILCMYFSNNVDTLDVIGGLCMIAGGIIGLLLNRFADGDYTFTIVFGFFALIGTCIGIYRYSQGLASQFDNVPAWLNIPSWFGF